MGPRFIFFRVIGCLIFLASKPVGWVRKTSCYWVISFLTGYSADDYWITRGNGASFIHSFIQSGLARVDSPRGSGQSFQIFRSCASENVPGYLVVPVAIIMAKQQFCFTNRNEIVKVYQHE